MLCRAVTPFFLESESTNNSAAWGVFETAAARAFLVLTRNPFYSHNHVVCQPWEAPDSFENILMTFAILVSQNNLKSQSLGNPVRNFHFKPRNKAQHWTKSL